MNLFVKSVNPNAIELGGYFLFKFIANAVKLACKVMLFRPCTLAHLLGIALTGIYRFASTSLTFSRICFLK